MIKNKISVVIPFYNAEKTIIECIDSVVAELRTVHCEWEIITVDDGSTDDSYNLLFKYLSGNQLQDKIRIIRQENGGAGAARNRGLAECTGNYIAFNDSDDKWIEGKIRMQLDIFDKYPDVSMIGGLHDNDCISVPWKTINEENLITLRDMIFKFYFTTPGVMFKKELLKLTGLFNPKQRNAEEGLFFFRMTYYGKCILVKKMFSKNILGKKSWGQSGLSGQIHKQSIGELRNLTTIYQEGLIGFKYFSLAYIFSLLKYLLRIFKYYILK